MKFNITRNVKAPARRNGQDAGFDFFVPEYSQEFAEEFKNKNTKSVISESGIEVPPHSTVIIPSGVKSSFESNIALIVQNKSGVASKKFLDVMSCVIDSSYQGEIYLNLLNTSDNPVGISFGEKITQAVPFFIYHGDYEVVSGVSDEEFYLEKSSRGISAFGSNYQDKQ